MTAQICKFIRKQDQYGYPITLLYNGRSTYQTVFGASITFVSYFLILFFFSWRLEELFSNSNQFNQTEVVKIDLIDDQQHSLADESYKFLITTNTEVPESIGTWKAYKGYMTPKNGYKGYKETRDGYQFLRKEIPLRNCSHLFNDQKFKQYQLKRMPEEQLIAVLGFSRCIEEGYDIIQGGNTDPMFKSIEMEFVHCRENVDAKFVGKC